MTDPNSLLIEAALGSAALLTVGSFIKLYALDKKFGEMLLLLSHEDIGLLARVKKVEGRQRRHSDALKAMGAELEE